MKVNKQLTLPNLIYFHAQQLCIIPHWPNYPYYAVFWTCSDEDEDELPLLDRLADGKNSLPNVTRFMKYPGKCPILLLRVKLEKPGYNENCAQNTEQSQ